MRYFKVIKGHCRGFRVGGNNIKFRYFKGKGWRLTINVRTDKWINRLGFNSKVIESKKLGA